MRSDGADSQPAHVTAGALPSVRIARRAAASALRIASIVNGIGSRRGEDRAVRLLRGFLWFELVHAGISHQREKQVAAADGVRAHASEVADQMILQRARRAARARER